MDAILLFGVVIAILIGVWKTFSKAGQPGWASIIPVYNAYTLTQVSGSGLVWFGLIFVPVINIMAYIKISTDVSRSFGRGVGTALGLIFLPFIFYPIIGFGSAEYEGPAAA